MDSAEKRHVTYWGLLNDNVPDNEVLVVELVNSGVRLGVLQEGEEEASALDGPASYSQQKCQKRNDDMFCESFEPCVVLKGFAWAVRPTPPL
jgi:hypothetical protein